MLILPSEGELPLGDIQRVGESGIDGILVQGIEPTATRLSFVPGAHVENGRQLCPGPYRGCKLVLGVLDVESPLTLHFLTGCNAGGQEPMNEPWPAGLPLSSHRQAGRGVRLVGVSLVLSLWLQCMQQPMFRLTHVSSFSVMLSLCPLLSLTHVRLLVPSTL